MAFWSPSGAGPTRQVDAVHFEPPAKPGGGEPIARIKPIEVKLYNRSVPAGRFTTIGKNLGCRGDG